MNDGTVPSEALKIIGLQQEILTFKQTIESLKLSLKHANRRVDRLVEGREVADEIHLGIIEKLLVRIEAISKDS